MEDIVPALYKRIKDDYISRVKENSTVQSLLNKAEKGSGTQDEISLYARALGYCAAKALEEGLKADNLPDGKIYWFIADRTIKPLFKLVYEQVYAMASTVQNAEDKKNGISIKPQKSPFPTDRIEAIEGKIVQMSLGGTDEN